MKDRGQISGHGVWLGLLALALLFGVVFRVVGLGDRVYWVDEVATSIRISGYTRAQVVVQLSDGLPRSPAQVQQFLHPAADLTLLQVWGALTQSPEHAPLYFLLAHGWARLWGSSVVALRSLSVVCSLGAIALMGRLAAQLFGSVRTGAIAMTLLALSPFFVSYAQEARPYSLWSVMLLWSGVALLGAMRRPTGWRWLHYGVAATLGLYTSLLSGLVLLGQGLYVLWMGDGKQRQGLMLAAGLAALAFVPWGLVVLHQWGRLQSNTEWMREPMRMLALLVVWLYSLVVVFFDAPVEVSQPGVVVLKGLTALLTLGAIAAALGWVWQRSAPPVGAFVAALLLPVPTVLIAIDIMRDGQASATPRYLMPMQLAVLLAVAGWLSCWRSPRQWRQGILAFLVVIGVLSCLSNLNRTPDYQKDRNRHNDAIAAMLNPPPAPRLITEPTQTLDLLSLSLDLKPDVTLQIMDRQPILPQRCETIFLLNPSASLQKQLQQGDRIKIQEIFRPPLLTGADIHLSLWSATDADASCPS